jgi:hypothetical protein
LSQQWLCVDIPGNGVHVLPIDDLIVHSESRSCFCCPRVSLVHAGSVVVCDGRRHTPAQFVRELVVHEAMDGRG